MLLPTFAQAFEPSLLDMFEKRATHPQEAEFQPYVKDDRQDYVKPHANSDLNNDPDSDFFEFLTYLTIAGGAASLAKTNATVHEQMKATGTDFALRQLGDPLIPLVRIDYFEQRVDSSISAKDYRYELGYGPFAIQMNKTKFTETLAKTQLNLTRMFGLYRMSFGSNVEIGMGFGKLVIEGKENNTQFLSTFPILLHLDNKLGVEFRPAFTSGINDYDLALLYDYNYVSLKVGYRWLLTQDVFTSLSGPYTGLVLHF